MEAVRCRWILLAVGYCCFFSNSIVATAIQVKSDEEMLVQNVPDLYKATVSHFDVPIYDQVSASGGKSYVFPYRFFLNETWTISVCIECITATEEVPLLVVVRQSQSIMSWQVPLAFAHSNYSRVCHTLCPLRNYIDPSIRPGHQNLYIDVTSNSVPFTRFTLLASNVTDFTISTGELKLLNVTPSVPKVQEYHMPDNVDSVLVQVTSNDDFCMTLAIEDIECPFYDTHRKLQQKGLYQTMIYKGGITVDRETFKEGKVYIVMLLDSTNERCSYDEDTNSKDQRRKEVLLMVKPKITSKEFTFAILRVLGIYFAFYVTAIIYCLVVFYRNLKRKQRNLLRNNENVASNRHDYGSIYGVGDRNLAQMPIVEEAESGEENGAQAQGSGEEEEFVIVRTQEQQTAVHGVDLIIERERYLEERARIYSWNVLTMAIFYGIPVAQLVYTNQKIINLTGNQDVCYYNFLCSHKSWIFSDFNHIYSNIGYVMLGVLFLLLVLRKDHLHSMRMDRLRRQRVENFPGILHHFGIFYAMGWALVMEGILSACYHICPNKANFQFDTAFMYVISTMCMLQLYQSRNRYITARPHITCIALAVIIFVGVISEAQNGIIFWIIFSVVHIIYAILLSIYVYHMGKWKLDRGVCKRIAAFYRKLKVDCRERRFPPTYKERFVLLTVAVILNVGLDLYGLITRPSNFASFLLTIFILNLALYLAYYMIMKCYHKEKIPWFSWLYVVLSISCWIPAVIYFLTKNTEWEATPALSRNENKACVIWNFFDDHDIWHFLSSCGLFFSFMVLFTLDDELVDVPNNEIEIF